MHHCIRYRLSFWIVAGFLLSASPFLPSATSTVRAGDVPPLPGVAVEDGRVSVDSEAFVRGFYRDAERSLRRVGHGAMSLQVGDFIQVSREQFRTRRIDELLTHPVGWHLVISSGQRTSVVNGDTVKRRPIFDLQWRYREPWWPVSQNDTYEALWQMDVAEFAATAVSRGEEDWAIDHLTSFQVTLSDGSETRVYRSILTIVGGKGEGLVSLQVRDPVLDNVSSAVSWIPRVHALLRPEADSISME